MKKTKKKQKTGKTQLQSMGAVKKDSRIVAWKAQMLQQIEAEAYADAIMTLATMIEAKCYDAECMYQGAYAYFMSGDYTRATQWVQNTLQYDGRNVPARLLLARICILEDRAAEGLAIFDFILRNFPGKLDENQQEDVRDILDYYGKNEPERIGKEYPAIEAFLGLTAVPGQVETQVTAPGATTQTKTFAVTADLHKAEQEVQQVRAKDISIVEKIKILHTFGGGYFYQGDLAAAKLFLAEALQLDAKDDRTLYNLAVLYGEMGDREKALQFAMAMSYVDFKLLQALR